VSALPFLSLPDPKVSGEGALDPLGLATIADRLADWILPGFTARMARPRFLTAMAVAAVVCDGFEDEATADGTPAHLVFEWHLVEAFVRAAERATVSRTPGIDKATTARNEGVPMSARRYLKTPMVFGFHGVYKRLGRHLGVVDDELTLGESGYALLKVWEREQGIPRFVESIGRGGSHAFRETVRAAVIDGVAAGCTKRSSGWRGWEMLAKHLSPGLAGKRERETIRFLLLSKELFDAMLRRHAEVQKAKPPDGKREWFEPTPDGRVFVRPPYRLDDEPEPREWWPRPYRLDAVRSFCRDLEGNGA
jgi:hypothetical protein